MIIGGIILANLSHSCVRLIERVRGQLQLWKWPLKFIDLVIWNILNFYILHMLSILSPSLADDSTEHENNSLNPKCSWLTWTFKGFSVKNKSQYPKAASAWWKSKRSLPLSWRFWSHLTAAWQEAPICKVRTNCANCLSFHFWFFLLLISSLLYPAL